MHVFHSRIMTNWLLLGIFVTMVAQFWTKNERAALAETLMLDNCITMTVEDAPRQFLHVVSHPAKE